MRNIFSIGIFLAVLSTGFFSCEKDEYIENKVPAADAGPSQTTTLPADSVKLTGSGTDADGKVVAYLWSQVSGPVATTIVNPGSPSTTVSGFVAGSYVFQLMVTDDKGATGVDTAVVTVHPATVKTLTLQPANNPYEFTVAALGSDDASHLTNNSIDADTWTKDGKTYYLRGFIKFDLSAIPANATIISANLYLYSHPTPSTGNLADANFGSSNELLVQQISANWSPSTITWFNQPAGATNNQVLVPATTQSQLDLNVNVKNIVASMVNNNANYGFVVKLQNEVTYNSRIFVSSHNATYPAKHPKLVVVYQ